MKKIKVLNLYAVIGGNRKLWENVDVTAVEFNKDIARIYKDFFPQDEVVIEDAHEYLLNNYKKYDFIWSSPPCPSHSRTNWFLHGQGHIRYPDMKLYEEILFLKHWAKSKKWVVENVIPYYKPLIKPQELGRHYFWANFVINPIKIDYVDIGTMNRQASKHAQRRALISEAEVPELVDLHGLDIRKYRHVKNKRRILRNCVLPKIGTHIFNCAYKEVQFTLGGKNA